MKKSKWANISTWSSLSVIIPVLTLSLVILRVSLSVVCVILVLRVRVRVLRAVNTLDPRLRESIFLSVGLLGRAIRYRNLLGIVCNLRFVQHSRWIVFTLPQLGARCKSMNGKLARSLTIKEARTCSWNRTAFLWVLHPSSVFITHIFPIRIMREMLMFILLMTACYRLYMLLHILLLVIWLNLGAWVRPEHLVCGRIWFLFMLILNVFLLVYFIVSWGLLNSFLEM